MSEQDATPQGEQPQGVGASSDAVHGRRDMFGASGYGDTSGFGGIAVRPDQLTSSPRPYGGWFDEAADSLEKAFAGFSDAIERVVVHAGELTLFVKREAIADICRTLRD